MKTKTLYITGALLVDFLKHPSGPGLSAEGVPSDLEIVGCTWDPRGILELTVRSAEFVEDGGDFVPMFHREAA